MTGFKLGEGPLEGDTDEQMRNWEQQEEPMEQLGEDPQILADIARATKELAEFLKAEQLEVDYCEADWRDTKELIEGAYELILKHPGWQLHYIGGDDLGIDANFVLFTSKSVADETALKIMELIENEGAELPGETLIKCPKCGKVLTGLGVTWSASDIPGIASLQGEELYTDVLDGIKLIELIEEDSAIYWCLECEAELFHAGEEDKVKVFLKGELKEAKNGNEHNQPHTV